MPGFFAQREGRRRASPAVVAPLQVIFSPKNSIAIRQPPGKSINEWNQMVPLATKAACT
jgi:hypothetical protein